VLLSLVLIVAAIAFAWLPAWITDAGAGGIFPAEPGPARESIDTLLVAVVLVSMILVPCFANRRHLEPRQFASAPASSAQIGWGLILSTPVTWATLLLIVWMAAFVVFRPDLGGIWWGVLLAGILTLLFGIAAGRLMSALSKLVTGRRSAGILRVVGLLLLLAATPVAVFALTQILQAPDTAGVHLTANVIGWTPFGAPVSGTMLLIAGDTAGGLIRFGILAAAILILLAAWFPVVRYSIEHIERPAVDEVASDGLGWFERVSDRPSGVIGARALSYWARDPRYRVALAAIPFAPVLMVTALWIAGVELPTLALVPLPAILGLFGWSLHNDVAMDSTAIWSHVASGTRGRDDRIGRLYPVMIIGLPLVLIGSSVTVTVAGDWRVLPAVLGMNLAILLVACGAASVFSALMPYPATRPGDSPFAQPAIGGSGSGAAQTLSILCAAALAAPPVWLSAVAIAEVDFGLNIAALLLGALYGAAVLIAGVLLGGRIFNRVGPELVAVTQTFD